MFELNFVTGCHMQSQATALSSPRHTQSGCASFGVRKLDYSSRYHRFFFFLPSSRLCSIYDQLLAQILPLRVSPASTVYGTVHYCTFPGYHIPRNAHSVLLSTLRSKAFPTHLSKFPAAILDARLACRRFVPGTVERTRKEAFGEKLKENNRSVNFKPMVFISPNLDVGCVKRPASSLAENLAVNLAVLRMYA